MKKDLEWGGIFKQKNGGQAVELLLLVLGSLLTLVFFTH